MIYTQFICCLALIFSLLLTGCCCQQQKIDTKTKQPIVATEDPVSYQTKASLPKQTNSMQDNSLEPMRISFASPVVMVNGKRAEKKDSEMQEIENVVEVSFPQNSVQNIEMAVLDSEGLEHKLYGELKVFQYSSYSAPKGEKPDVIVVSPDEPEYTYSSILKNGYGEFSVRESVLNTEKGEFKKGEVLLHLILGTKKKNSQGLEFGFREGVISKVQGQKTPVSFLFKEEEKHIFQLEMDEEETRLEGELTVFRGNEHTQRSIVWITVDEEGKNYLTKRGGNLTMAIYIPSLESYPFKTTSVFISPDQNPVLLAKKYGTMVGLLKLRRLR